MYLQALLAADTQPPLGRRRAAVLDVLRAARSPLGVQEVADQMGLHPNTARFHLDALVDAGLATRASKQRKTPGRPSIAYHAVPDGGPAGQRRYRLLAEILTSLIAGMMPDPGEAAAEAGREWGRYLTERPAPYQRLDADQAISRLTATLEQTGFAPQAPQAPETPEAPEAPEAPKAPKAAQAPQASTAPQAAKGPKAPQALQAPETTAEASTREIRLRHCPFREVAEDHQDIICRLHLGLMQGALAQMQAPLTADRLDPLVQPNLCIAHLRPDYDPGQRRSKQRPARSDRSSS